MVVNLHSVRGNLVRPQAEGSLRGAEGEREPGNHCMRMRQSYQQNMVR